MGYWWIIRSPILFAYLVRDTHKRILFSLHSSKTKKVFPQHLAAGSETLYEVDMSLSISTASSDIQPLQGLYKTKHMNTLMPIMFPTEKNYVHHNSHVFLELYCDFCFD